MIPERSPQAQSAISVFFEESNDIDIFIEDTAYGYSKLFTTLFSRVFINDYKIGRVYPLGGRTAVIEQHAENSSNRPSLYIIDGDLFLLNGDNVENGNGLFKFPYYCVENVLCDPNALLYLLDEEEPVKDINELYSLLNYENWLQENENKLFSLFVEYAISMFLNPQEQTVAFKVSDLVSGNKGDINETKLSTRIDSLKELVIAKSSQEEYESIKHQILSSFNESGLNKLDVISGKDYLFPLLKTRAKSIVKTSISDINFKLRLAKVCDIGKLNSAKDYIAN
ncbi:DUF4435 domain-containing protein [Gammaproteobacteria bacterium AS21]